MCLDCDGDYILPDGTCTNNCGDFGLFSNDFTSPKLCVTGCSLADGLAVDHELQSCVNISSLTYYGDIIHCKEGHAQNESSGYLFMCDICKDGFWYRALDFYNSACYENMWLGVTGDDYHVYERRDLDLGDFDYTPIMYTAPLPYAIGDLAAGTNYTYRNYTYCKAGFIDPTKCDLTTMNPEDCC